MEMLQSKKWFYSSQSQIQMKDDTLHIFVGLGGAGRKISQKIQNVLKEYYCDDHIAFLEIDHYEELEESQGISIQYNKNLYFSLREFINPNWIIEPEMKIHVLNALSERYQQIIDFVNKKIAKNKKDSIVKFHLFTSMCGYTGSNILIDLAYFLKANYLDAQIDSYCVLGDVIYKDFNKQINKVNIHKMKMQEYYSFQVLNHCLKLNSTHNLYSAFIEKNQLEEQFESPFEHCFILGNQDMTLEQVAQLTADYMLMSLCDDTYSTVIDQQQSDGTYICLNTASNKIPFKQMQTYLVCSFLNSVQEVKDYNDKNGAFELVKFVLDGNISDSIEELYQLFEVKVKSEAEEELKSQVASFMQKLYDYQDKILKDHTKGIQYLYKLMYGTDITSMIGLIKTLNDQCKKVEEISTKHVELYNTLIDSCEELRKDYENAQQRIEKSKIIKKFLIFVEYELKEKWNKEYKPLLEATHRFNEYAIEWLQQESSCLIEEIRKSLTNSLNVMDFKMIYQEYVAVMIDAIKNHKDIYDCVQRFFDDKFVSIIHEQYELCIQKHSPYQSLDEDSHKVLQVCQRLHEKSCIWNLNAKLVNLIHQNLKTIIYYPDTILHRIVAEKYAKKQDVISKFSNYLQVTTIMLDVELIHLQYFQNLESECFDLNSQYAPLSTPFYSAYSSPSLKVDVYCQKVKKVMYQAISCKFLQFDEFCGTGVVYLNMYEENTKARIMNLLESNDINDLLKVQSLLNDRVKGTMWFSDCLNVLWNNLSVYQRLNKEIQWYQNVLAKLNDQLNECLK